MPLSQAQPSEIPRGSRGDSDLHLWAYRLAILLLTAAGAAVRMAHLTAKPYWFDECFSVELARLDWSNFLRVLWWREANMTLYYLLLRGWLHFGQSEFYIRGLSALLSAATIPAVYWLAAKLYDRRVALLAAALLTLNPYSVRYAQEARSYALFVLLAVLSSGCFILWLRRHSHGYWLAYVLTSVLAVYAHLYALLVVLAQFLVLRWLGPPPAGSANAPLGDTVAPQERKPAAVTASGGTTGSRALPETADRVSTFDGWTAGKGIAEIQRAWKIIALGVLPLLVFVVKTGAGPIRWIHRPGLRDLIAFCEQFSGGGWLALICFAFCLAALAPLGAPLWHSPRDWKTWRARFLLVWLLLPIVLTVVLSFARPVFLPRYMIGCLPALMILVAAGIARLRRAWLIGPAVVGVLLLSLPGVSFVYGHDYDDERDGSGAATDFILEHAQPGDGVIFHIAEERAPYEFFRTLRAGENTASVHFTTALGPEILYPHSGAGFAFADFKAKLTPELLGAVMAGHPRVWVVLIYNGGDHPDAATTLLTHTLPERFSRSQRWQFPKVEVRLYGSK